MSYENISIQDCLDNFLYKGKRVLLNKGQVIGFEEVSKHGYKKALQDWGPNKAHNKLFN